jgi:hypothetical protein
VLSRTLTKFSDKIFKIWSIGEISLLNEKQQLVTSFLQMAVKGRALCMVEPKYPDMAKKAEAGATAELKQKVAE